MTDNLCGVGFISSTGSYSELFLNEPLLPQPRQRNSGNSMSHAIFVTIDVVLDTLKSMWQRIARR